MSRPACCRRKSHRVVRLSASASFLSVFLRNFTLPLLLVPDLLPLSHLTFIHLKDRQEEHNEVITPKSHLKLELFLSQAPTSRTETECEALQSSPECKFMVYVQWSERMLLKLSRSRSDVHGWIMDPRVL